MVPNPQELDNEALNNFRSILNYLVGGHGFEVLEPLLEGISTDERVNKQGEAWSDLNRYSFVNALIDYTGLTSAEYPDSDRLDLRFTREAPVFIGQYKAFHYARSNIYSGDAFLTFKVFGETVKARKDSNESVIRFVDEAGQELAVLDMYGWISEKDPDQMNRDAGPNQYLEQEDLSFDVELKSIGTIQLVARSLSFSKRLGEWHFRSGEFWFLVPGS